jgi:hypothetical protein
VNSIVAAVVNVTKTMTMTMAMTMTDTMRLEAPRHHRRATHCE